MYNGYRSTVFKMTIHISVHWFLIFLFKVRSPIVPYCQYGVYARIIIFCYSTFRVFVVLGTVTTVSV